MSDGKKGSGVGLGSGGDYDKELYGGSKGEKYVKAIPMDAEDETPAEPAKAVASKPKGVSAKTFQDEIPGGAGDDPFKEHTQGKYIADREDEYRAKGRQRMLSPDRADPFADSTPAPELSTYKDVMIGQQLDKEKREVLLKIQKQKEEEATRKAEGKDAPADAKKRRWDASEAKAAEKSKGKSDSKDGDRWETPVGGDSGIDTPVVISRTKEKVRRRVFEMTLPWARMNLERRPHRASGARPRRSAEQRRRERAGMQLRELAGPVLPQVV